MATKGLGQAARVANALGVPSSITSYVTDPIGSVARGLGVPDQVIEVGKFAMNPGGYAAGMAKDFIKDKAMETFRNLPGVPNEELDTRPGEMAKGGKVKMAKGGSVSSASKRADGCAQRGKTRGRML